MELITLPEAERVPCRNGSCRRRGDRTEILGDDGATEILREDEGTELIGRGMNAAPHSDAGKTELLVDAGRGTELLVDSGGGTGILIEDGGGANRPAERRLQ